MHAGGPLCSAVTPEAWWRDYWPLVNLLLAAQDGSLRDYVGPDNVDAVEAFISKSEEHTAAIVNARLTSAISVSVRRMAGSLTTGELADIRRRISSIHQVYSENEKCPACENIGEIGGENAISEERFDGEVDEEGDWLPGETRYEISSDSFVCKNCGLILIGPEELAAADISESFEVVETDDAYDFEPEYGND